MLQRVIVCGFGISAKSNGAMVLFELCKILDLSGYDTAYLCFESPDKDNYFKDNDYVENSGNIAYYYLNVSFYSCDIRATDIVVYPELIEGNPLAAKRVIRYLLNKPYYLTGSGIVYGYSDYVLAYSKVISNSLPQLFLLKDEQVVCRQADRDLYGLALVYFGKTHISQVYDAFSKVEKFLHRFKKIIIVTRRDPAERSLLNGWLAQASVVVSFDPLTNLNFEATLSGSTVLLCDDYYKMQENGFNLELSGYFFDVADYETAVKEVAKVPELFREQRNTRNIDSVTETFKNAINHFEDFEKGSQLFYVHSRIKFIKSLFVNDYREYVNNGTEVMFNIDYYKDIPTVIRGTLQKTGKVDNRNYLKRSIQTKRLSKCKQLIKKVIRKIF